MVAPERIPFQTECIYANCSNRRVRLDKMAGLRMVLALGGRILYPSHPAAFSIVETSGAEPAQVGQTLDLMEVRLVGCQLGLFGHSPEEKPVRPAESVSSELSARIKAGLKEGRLPCAAAWAIAEELKLPKMAVSSASEKLGIKIKPCQLGAF